MNESDSVLRLARQLAGIAKPLVESRPRPKELPPSGPSLTDLYALMIDDSELIAATAGLFRNGHYAQAVEEAYKLLNNAVKRKAGNPKDASGQPYDGVSLMQHVFSKDKPLLRLNNLRTESDKNEQDGYRFIFAGSILGIRNPRAHSHNLNDEPKLALELLVEANHLLRAVARSRRTRPR